MKTITTTLIDVDEIAKLCGELIGVKNYSDLVSDMEWNNYSCYRFELVETLDTYETKYFPKEMAENIRTKQVKYIRPCLHALANAGKIPWGTLIIDVSW